MISEIKNILSEALQIGDRIDTFDASTPLLGNLPEFDSMTVVTVLTLIEEQLDLVVPDDEVTADVFETVGSLTAFVERLSG